MSISHISHIYRILPDDVDLGRRQTYICCNNKEAIADVLAYLSEHFEMKTQPTNRFIGMEIYMDSEARKICVHSSSFTNFLSRFKKTDFKPRAILAYPHVRMLKKMSPSTRTEKMSMANVPYQVSVGFLNYLTCPTRPEKKDLPPIK